ncbi:neutral and basic amino acid transport protein rBAT isoform X2 [Achroia grisella]|uniref:neutral and basic amino acid transport protein rBAT isoform X2 n=1 Tax=Achroia grisella TaxID=688607 RepID=UPI0027D27CC5|nr:neutral and basic amino acid transport protein rBAT isoform X2 [Achroia grisella]
MSEPRKNHLSIDGGQVKEDDNVATYKPIPESDTDFRTVKSNLTKSKEKVSDEAEEKLLDKEAEAKIVTRVDMADAKYVVGDHRNGDAKIELDANKRFSGLTKEELLKYADDPFWVRLRWFMFILFWALWLCMLAGAIAIIIRAPKCAPPKPKTWFEKGPLVDMTLTKTYADIEEHLKLIQDSKVQGIFIDVPLTYEVLDQTEPIEQFKAFLVKAKQYGTKVIVDLTPNFVFNTSRWFELSVNRTGEYTDYFIWAKGKGFSSNGSRQEPNNWVSTLDTPAWTYNEQRDEFYLHQFGSEKPDLDFHNSAVVEHFDKVLKIWMKAGADGVRLRNARHLLVNTSLLDENMESDAGSVKGADHLQYKFWRHQHTTDQPGLDELLARWSKLVDDNGPTPGAGETVFTLKETMRPELFLLAHNVTSLRPPSAAPFTDQAVNASTLSAKLSDRLPHWPALQLATVEDAELAEFAILLPAVPVFDIEQLRPAGNDSEATTLLKHLVPLRDDATIEHGKYDIAVVPAVNSSVEMLACARWKSGHTGYLAVLNPSTEDAVANLTLPTVPASVTVHHVTQTVKMRTNYINNMALPRDGVLVPQGATVVLSYVPAMAAEN